MNVTVEKLGPCKRLLRVEIGTEQVEEAFKTVTGEFQHEARLPGFRPGKAPKEMVAKRFENEIQEEVKHKLISEAYKKAVVGRPDVEEIQFNRGQPLQFAANLETAPEFELPEYKGLPASREIASVTPQDIERALQTLAQRQTKFETVARELRSGDVAVVNYSGACGADGPRIDGAKGFLDQCRWDIVYTRIRRPTGRYEGGGQAPDHRRFSGRFCRAAVGGKEGRV